MKKFYFLFALLFTSTINAQVINFADPYLKARLIEASPVNDIAKNSFGQNIAIDINANGEIEMSETTPVRQLKLVGANISNLEGIQNFTGLTRIECGTNMISDITILNSISTLQVVNAFGNPIQTVDVTPLVNLTSLDLYACQLNSLNISGLSSLTEVMVNENNLTEIDLTGCSSLSKLFIRDNALTALDLTPVAPTLFELQCFNNQLTELVLENMYSLGYLFCNNNQITNLDISGAPNLYSIDCSGNGLVYLNMKNGRIDYISIWDNPGLQYICADEQELYSVQNHIEQNGLTNCSLNTYCTFSPGGSYYVIGGTNYLNGQGDGCDGTETSFAHLRFTVSNGNQSGTVLPSGSGNYLVGLSQGNYSITPSVENPEFFNISPGVVNVSFPSMTSPVSQNFCVSPNGIHPDIEIVLFPISPARPGFDASYNIFYRNKGNVAASGVITFEFDDSVLDFVESSVLPDVATSGQLSWNYSALDPFEWNVINVVLNVNSPMETPAVNIGDELGFHAVISPVSDDENPLDNTFDLKQTVVGSHDPNDKTCLQGNTVGPDMIGEYVHYVIRFENTGTFAAQNIVVKDMIDTAKFDIATLIPLDASHTFETRTSAGNKVEFIFENIMLSFDDANNDGYVAFKIKTQPTLVLGDTFSNTASIYFDYNFPIVTNTALTTIQELGTNDFEFSKHFTLYPVPANDNLKIKADNAIVNSVSVYNTIGQLLFSVTDSNLEDGIDVSHLARGSYFVRIKSDKGTSVAPFVKQ